VVKITDDTLGILSQTDIFKHAPEVALVHVGIALRRIGIQVNAEHGMRRLVVQQLLDVLVR